MCPRWKAGRSKSSGRLNQKAPSGAFSLSGVKLSQHLRDPIPQLVPLGPQEVHLGPRVVELFAKSHQLSPQLAQPRIRPSARRLRVRDVDPRPLESDLELPAFG